MPSVFEKMREDCLTWLPEHGVGYYPVRDEDVYDDAYFGKYQGYADTEVGRRLTQLRVDLVRRYAPGRGLLDVGIGCGQFLEAIAETDASFLFQGWDVNPVAVAWLRDRNMLAHPMGSHWSAMTFWDSLEHLPDPEVVLARAHDWVFVSVPVFRDAGHVLASKHFRKDEHYWYFTEWGLVAWMRRLGFAKLYASRIEEELGRQDIGTFVFQRQSPGPLTPAAV